MYVEQIRKSTATESANHAAFFSVKTRTPLRRSGWRRFAGVAERKRGTL